MNLIMLAKIEACFDLAKNAKEFRKNVKLVTGLTNVGFDNCELASSIESKMMSEVSRQIITEHINKFY